MNLEELHALITAWDAETREDTHAYLVGFLCGLAQLGDATASLALEQFTTRGETRELFRRNGLKC